MRYELIQLLDGESYVLAVYDTALNCVLDKILMVMMTHGDFVCRLAIMA